METCKERGEQSIWHHTLDSWHGQDSCRSVCAVQVLTLKVSNPNPDSNPNPNPQGLRLKVSDTWRHWFQALTTLTRCILRTYLCSQGPSHVSPRTTFTHRTNALRAALCLHAAKLWPNTCLAWASSRAATRHVAPASRSETQRCRVHDVQCSTEALKRVHSRCWVHHVRHA